MQWSKSTNQQNKTAENWLTLLPFPDLILAFFDRRRRTKHNESISEHLQDFGGNLAGAENEQSNRCHIED